MHSHLHAPPLAQADYSSTSWELAAHPVADTELISMWISAADDRASRAVLAAVDALPARAVSGEEERPLRASLGSPPPSSRGPRSRRARREAAGRFVDMRFLGDGSACVVTNDRRIIPEVACHHLRLALSAAARSPAAPPPPLLQQLNRPDLWDLAFTVDVRPRTTTLRVDLGFAGVIRSTTWVASTRVGWREGWRR
jgi:hypothetical protein